jgi:hypothetical protein
VFIFLKGPFECYISSARSVFLNQSQRYIQRTSRGAGQDSTKFSTSIHFLVVALHTGAPEDQAALTSSQRAFRQSQRDIQLLRLSSERLNSQIAT